MASIIHFNKYLSMEKGDNNHDCHGELAPGQKCNSCGAYRTTEQESAETLRRAQQPPYDEFSTKFAGNVKELTAMIDLRARLNYPFSDRAKTDKMVERIRKGELPSVLVLET